MGLQLELYCTSTTVIEYAQTVTSIKWGTQGTIMNLGNMPT